MGIHHSEFEKMFEVLKRDISTPLKVAVKRWEHIKDTRDETIQNWLEVLKEKTKSYMDEGYSVDTAMMEAWGSSYQGISDDSQKCCFNISELRESFFEGALDELESYEEDLIAKAGRYLCKECG